jgi:LmbE family N-acetylglucosaminyl deacetylase
MNNSLKLMAILAHPDDESLGNGGILARYAAEGIETHLVTATRGERGWFGEESEYPGPATLGKIRETELHEAASVLGLQSVTFLNYLDGDLDSVHPAEIIALLVGEIRRVRPEVVVTFGPYGGYGHPDHIAISQFTLAAIVEAANPYSTYQHDLPTHSVSKLYYMAETCEMFEVYESVFGQLKMQIDGTNRGIVCWPEWSTTAQIETWDYRENILRAIACHRTQAPAYHVLAELPESSRRQLWGKQNYYRVFSRVNGGRRVEQDLFEGLR